MEDVTQFPRHDSVVHGGKAQGDGPEGLRPLLLEGADDRGTDMLLFDWGLAAVYRLVNGGGLKVRILVYF